MRITSARSIHVSFHCTLCLSKSVPVAAYSVVCVVVWGVAWCFVIDVLCICRVVMRALTLCSVLCCVVLCCDGLHRLVWCGVVWCGVVQVLWWRSEAARTKARTVEW